MNIGLSSGAFPANMTIPQSLRLAKRSGFDCVELDISEAGYLTPGSDPKAVLFLRRAVENMSLYVGCVRADVLSNGFVDAYDDILERCVEICAELGSTRLAVPLSTVGDIKSAESRLTDALRNVCDQAVRLDVSIALECGPGGLLPSPMMARLYIDRIACDVVGACIDTSDTLAGGTPQEWIRTLGNCVKMVHARDHRRLPDGQVEPANLLEGDVEWKEVRKALVDIGYNAAVIAREPGYRQYVDLGIKHCGDKMKRIFGSAGAGE